MRTLKEVQDQFPGAAEAGLAPDAAEQSAQRFGVNKLTPLPREPLWKKFLEKFDEPIIKVLLAAALLSMFVDMFQKDSASAPVVAGVALGVVAAAVAALFALKKGHWVPAMLFGSAVVLFILSWAVPPHEPSIEGLAVMVAVILATGVAFASEYKSDREFEVLNAHKEALRVKVLRGGKFHTLGVEEVVVGDAVELETGDEIPADGRLVKATELYVDQSLMTGESAPVVKTPQAADFASDGPEQPGCLYRGTQVVDGVGRMLVTDVGDATYLGQIARRLSADEGEEDEDEAAAAPDTAERRARRKLTISKELTPLQLKLKNLADLISKVGYIAAALIFAALLVRGLIWQEVRFTPHFVVNPQTGKYVLDEKRDRVTDESLGVMESQTQALLDTGGNLLNYFVYMVIVIVVAVPEGLPMSVTVSLALAMQKMTRANSLVRQLVACETVGSATVICSDKTGTLTQNKMQVVRLFADGRTIDRGTLDWTWPDARRPWPRDGQPLDWIVLSAAVNSTANLESKQGKLVAVGNSTEGALLQWLREAGIDYQLLRKQFQPIYQVHFSSERKRMTTVAPYGGRVVVLAKGAPEWVLGQSTHYQTADGRAAPWTPEARAAVEAFLRDSASQAMRALAFGYAELPADAPADPDALHARRDALEANLVFAGLVAIRDPLREDVKDAIDRCRQAGIEVKMITGDNVETARAIAYDIGLIDRRDAPIDTDDAVVLTSPKFNELHDRLKELKGRGDAAAAAVEDHIANMRVLARARPLDKYKMVEVLQDRQQVVAVTGDGTNDAPALKKADVGLAMGIAGTEVAKEASKIVLLDDAFSTIVKAVHWGRSLYENIQRFIQFQLTINVSALTIAFLGPLLGVRPPFTVLQLLWINVIMDTFAAIALCSEPPREGVMRLPPKRKDENILTRPMLATIFGTAAFFVVVMITLLLLMKGSPKQPGLFAGPSAENPAVWSNEFPELTYYQVSIFFTVYVFFQVWNQINARSLTPEMSGFHGLLKNPTFLTIAGITAVVQALIVSVPYIGTVFNVQPKDLQYWKPLGPPEWACILAGTASVLAFGEVLRRVRLAMRRKTA
jgi:Ca2+-transporting ATPase